MGENTIFTALVRRAVDSIRRHFDLGFSRPPEVRVGDLGSVNFRAGEAYRYCPECGTEESPLPIYRDSGTPPRGNPGVTMKIRMEVQPAEGGRPIGLSFDVYMGLPESEFHKLGECLTKNMADIVYGRKPQ